MKKGGFAYHTNPALTYPYIRETFENKEICELSEVHLVKPTHTMITLPYNSSFVELTKLGYRIQYISSDAQNLKKVLILFCSQLPELLNILKYPTGVTNAKLTSQKGLKFIQLSTLLKERTFVVLPVHDK